MGEQRENRAIGFRAETAVVHWAVVEGTCQSPTLLASGALPAPKAFTPEQQLAWFASQADILAENYRPSRAWVREAEGFAKTRRQFVAKRARVEGAIIAAVTKRGVVVTLGALASITKSVKPRQSSKSGTKASAKQYIGGSEFRGIALADFDDNLREAILCAAAALP